jgi:hypothetical protein
MIYSKRFDKILNIPEAFHHIDMKADMILLLFAQTEYVMFYFQSIPLAAAQGM